MFTKQHYQAIADTIRKAREHVRENSDTPWHAGELSDALMREFIGLFEGDNREFDRARFTSRTHVFIDHWEDEHVEPLPPL